MRSKPWIETPDGYDTPEQRRTTWTNAADELPDSDRIVIIYCPHASVFPVWLGWWCAADRLWCWETGDAVPQIVSHWMDLPEGPGGKERYS